ncbi:MAG: DUF2975 domain-containing protein [Sphingobacteriaceae bacterium]|nr:MAG: DUF2975 domain-containing protein [Sphingobacteriaceae bacterium]
MISAENTATQNVLKIMHVLAWIAFVGLMIEAGAIMVSYIVSCVNPHSSAKLYMDINWSPLREYDFWQYTMAVSYLIALPVLKALMAYWVIQILSDINLSNPFTSSVAKQIENISYILLTTWIVAVIRNEHYKWLIKRIGDLPFDRDAGEFLFMAGLVFIISQIFKRGVEIQAENDLTV